MTGLLLWIPLTAGLVAVALGLRQLRVYFEVGAGYKAKVLCTAIFASGRDLDPARADQVSADSYRILRPFRADIDRANRTVTASFAGFLPRLAIYRDGAGATLLVDDVQPAPIHSALPAVPPVRPWPSRSAGTDLHRVVAATFEEPHAKQRRTYAVVVVEDGEIVAEQYAPGIDPLMPLPGWSMAKSVLNALVGILVDDGRLVLNARELLPHWRDPDPRAAITVEDLLRMRSGLRFSEVYANPWSDVLYMLYRCGDMAGYASHRPLDAPPGTVWSYASGTSNIVSRLLRQVLGETQYHDWPRRALFDRIGMSSAMLEPDASGTFVCSSYMLATAREWARYGQLWADGGRCGDVEVLSPEWIGFSRTPTPQSSGRYGAHWWLKLSPEIGGDTAAAGRIAGDAMFAVGHEAQTLTVIPSKRLVIVRLGASIYVDAWDQAAFVDRVQGTLS